MRWAVGVLAIAALTADVIGLPGRAILVFAFVAIGPGYALAGRLEIEAQLRPLLIVTIGLAVTAAGSEALAIAGVWSSTRLLIALVALTLAGISLPRTAGRPR